MRYLIVLSVILVIRLNISKSINKESFDFLRHFSKRQYSGRRGGYRPPPCQSGGVYYLTEPFGVITSSGFENPHVYPSNQDCVWIVQAPTGTTVQVSIIELNLEPESNCNWDSLSIFEDTNDRLIDKICGYSGAGRIIESDTNIVRIEFHSDTSVELAGFKLEYRVIANVSSCVHTYCANGGSCRDTASGASCLCTPDYMGHRCESLIRSCANTQCMNGGSCIDIQGGTRCKCHTNYRGPLCEAPVLTCINTPCENGGSCTVTAIGIHCDCLPYYSGQRCELSVPSCANTQCANGGTCNNVAGGVHCDCPVDYTGQLCETNEACSRPEGTTREGTIGMIHSPGYGYLYYENHQHCVWHIVVPEGNKINITFIAIDIEGEEPCPYDQVTLTTSSSLVVSTSFCGRSIPPPIVTDDHTATVTFTSDESVTRTGFLLLYNAVLVGASGSCGGSFENEDSGEISSPSYPDTYPTLLHCEWNIKVHPGKVIRVEFSALDIEKVTGCRYDSLSLYDGATPSSAVLDTLCGNNVPGPYVTTGNKLTIVFNSDETEVRRGFWLRFREIDCDFCNNQPYSGPCGDPQFRVKERTDTNRIVGGSPANPHSLPWQVRLFSRGMFICGGTILSPFYILTAAHCTDGDVASAFSIVAGAHNINNHMPGREQSRHVGSVSQHPHYDVDKEGDKDVSILRLQSPLVITDYVRPACLRSEDVLAGTNCIVSGWGALSEGELPTETLQMVYLPIVTNEQCIHSYSASDITPAMLCAGDLNGSYDACQGDSGGPLVCKDADTDQYSVYGVTSWGYGCAMPGYYGVYARVHQLLAFIMESINGEVHVQ